MPDADLKVLVLWSPILRNDNKFAATQASAYLAEGRVQHFWDLWGFGHKQYTQLLGYPKGQTAWDVFLLYEQDLSWDGSLPSPTTWLNHRDGHGTKYSKSLLAKELKKLVGD